MKHLPFFLILGFLLSTGMLLEVLQGCNTYLKDESERLVRLDRRLADSPGLVLDSLNAIVPKALRRQDRAYYYLLLTIAQHKNHIPFPNDSAIAVAHDHYLNHSENHYNQARSSFYHGVVRYTLSPADTMAYRYFQEAARMIDDYAINDARLSALVYAFLGKINDFNHNFEEAAYYYLSAIDAEEAIGNNRNLIFDCCDLLITLSRFDDGRARSTLHKLDSILAGNPDFHSENVANAKAVYYLHSEKNLDSALFYCRKWKPAAGDLGAKYNMLASIYRKQGDLENAIIFEKASFELRREADEAFYHIYYRNLADLYAQMGNADSTARYARLAYDALHDHFDRRTEKRILELEKQYDVASRDAALERERRVRNVALLLLASAIVVLVLLFRAWRLLRRNAAMREREALKDAVAKSVINGVVSTYAGINKRLTVIHNLQEGERQEALNRFIQDNKTNISKNLVAALEKNYEDLPRDVREVDALLDGAQQRAVFILTEMDFAPGEIGSMLGISSSQVRTVKKAVRDRIAASPLVRSRSIRQLLVMQVGTQIGK